MFKEERIIDGKLCWRSTPDGPWTQYSVADMTRMLVDERARAAALESLLASWPRPKGE